MRQHPSRTRGWRFGVLIAAIVSLLFGGTTAVAAGRARSSGESSSTIAAVAAMQPGWGPSNTLDAIPTETSWGNPAITKGLFDSVRAQGFNSVRIPVTWYPHMGVGPNYTVDPTWMSRVKEVVDWALSDGFYVVLDVHHDSWEWIANMTTDSSGVLSEFNALWGQIAGEFQGESNKLVLESVNEPSFNGSPSDTQKAQMVDQLNRAFFNDVRHTGGNNATRMLMLPTVGDAPTQTFMDSLYNTIQSLNDPNLIASFHYYGYWPFSVNIAGVTTFDSNSQQDMVNDFSLAKSELIAKGVPVYAGEVGLLGYDYTKPGIVERGEMLKYFEMLGYEARNYGVTANYWDSYIDRYTFQPRDPGLFSQITSSWTTRSGTASTDMLFQSKSLPISDHTFTLIPNGTTYVGLRQGSTWLVYGTDYTLNGYQLTLKASAFSRLVGNRAYGVDSTIQAVYDHGVPWNISIITDDWPWVSNMAGNTGSFAIPTQFNGDVLATIKSTYSDGSAAGSASWTPYQEYWNAFIPDYTNNVIKLTSGFLGSLKDGAKVTLELHFWSGATVLYYVTKSGTSVTGTTS